MHPNERIVEIRHIDMTMTEEEVIVQMMMFFNDMGWIDEATQDAYDSLCEKISEPEPSDYLWEKRID